MKYDWKYEDARGVEKRGRLMEVVERQGSDVTYVFEDENGGTDLVSGSRLKKAERIDWE